MSYETLPDAGTKPANFRKTIRVNKITPPKNARAKPVIQDCDPKRLPARPIPSSDDDDMVAATCPVKPVIQFSYGSKRLPVPAKLTGSVDAEMVKAILAGFASGINKSKELLPRLNFDFDLADDWHELMTEPKAILEFALSPTSTSTNFGGAV